MTAAVTRGVTAAVTPGTAQAYGDGLRDTDRFDAIQVARAAAARARRGLAVFEVAVLCAALCRGVSSGGHIYIYI